MTNRDEMQVMDGRGDWVTYDEWQERMKRRQAYEGIKAIVFLAFIFMVAFVVIHAVTP